MRAGVRLGDLVADIYPAATGKPAPVVVTRTPYDRASHRSEGLAWARHGFAYVVQDVRGRYGSEGVWHPYRNERTDGAALADWILAQPWCDGRIVALGGSYGAYTAWTMAVERPAAVRAVISLGAAMGLAPVKFDRSGILRLAEHATWWAERAESRTSRTGLAAAMFAAEPQLIRHLPVADLEELMWPELRHWTDVIDRGPGCADPEAVRDDELAALDAATLHIGGRHDLLLDETLHQWHTSGPGRSLLVGPWDHDLGGDGVNLGETMLDWLGAVLDGKPPGPAARVFVAGHGWTEHEQWPPPTEPQTWHAHADGTLKPLPGKANGTFRYDPADPYPSADPGADRAALIRERTDAVRFLSDPLGEAVTVAGRPTVELDTEGGGDLVVRVLEVTAEGAAIALAQGVAGPGITLDEAAVRLPAGSRILLELTGSDFPLLARALGDDRYRGTDTTPVRRHVHRAALTLPVWTDR